ncbi:MAG: DUF362 domain-containing protein, partial [Planctomycetes bacterium]|nr:DUF362 domain-containing protein [Planctomycetota bacterium]
MRSSILDLRSLAGPAARAPTHSNTMNLVRVALAQGEDRLENVRRALGIVRNDLAPKVKGLVLIKPNFLSCTRQLAATHANPVRAVLEFVTPLAPSKVIVAEGACSGEAAVGYRNFNYLPLAHDFSVPLVDLCQETRWRPIRLLDCDGREVPAEVNALAAEADCRISVAAAKTHDTVVVTLSWKNMMGALRREHRSLMHGYPPGAPRDL